MDVDSIESEVADMDVNAIQSLKRKIDEICVKKEQKAPTPETQHRKEEGQGDRRSRSSRQSAPQK